MKIAVVTPSFPTQAEPYRGAPTWATLRHLNQLAELEVLCTNPRYPIRLQHRDFFHDAPDLSAYPEIKSQTVEFPAVPLLTRGLNGWTLQKTLASRIRAIRPDVLLTYWLYPEGYAATRLGRRLGIPSVIVSLGSDLKRIPNDPLVRRLTARAVQEASAVVGVSQDLGKVACGLGASPQRVHTVFNGVRTELFRLLDQTETRASLNVAPEVKLILYVGRFVPLKGIPNLIEAVRRLTVQSASRWELALIGNGSQEVELKAQAEAAGIADRLRFLGPQPPEQVARWMNAADLLCLPSESEGQPNVIVEALSCGRPVVATAVGGIPEIVTEDSGVLVRDNSADALVPALQLAVGRSWDREAISRRHRRGWEDAARETLRICEAVAAARRSPAMQPAFAPAR